jgi:hypothetical protein
VDKTAVPQVRARFLGADLGYTTNACEELRISCWEAHVSAKGRANVGHRWLEKFRLILHDACLPHAVDRCGDLSDLRNKLVSTYNQDKFNASLPWRVLGENRSLFLRPYIGYWLWSAMRARAKP